MNKRSYIHLSLFIGLLVKYVILVSVMERGIRGEVLEHDGSVGKVGGS